jgi:hypothetical protein
MDRRLVPPSAVGNRTAMECCDSSTVRIAALDVVWPTCNFNLTRLNRVDYSLTIAAQETIKDKVERRDIRIRGGAFRWGFSE